MAIFDALNPLKGEKLRFTAEELAELDTWFDDNSKPLELNDEDVIPVVTVEKLLVLLEEKKYHRRRFHYPSYAEIMAKVEEYKAGVTRVLSREQVLSMLNEWIREPEIKHELCLAFKVFDTEKMNFLEIDDLRSVVTGYGEVFTEAETQEMMRDANVRGDGNVFYNDFVETMFSNAPELYDIKIDYLYDDPDEDPSVPPEPIIVVETPDPVPVQEPQPNATPKAKTKAN